MLHVDERGSGTPVVLLHGAPTAPQHMWPLAERLAASGRWRVMLVHLPGYGRSAPLDPYAMEHSHALVEETLAARGVRAAHLVGFSGGAYRAIALAARGQLEVKTLTALAGTADFTADEKKGLAEYVTMLRGGVDPAPILVELMLSPRGRENAASVADIRGWATAIAPEHLARELEAFIAAPDQAARWAPSTFRCSCASDRSTLRHRPSAAIASERRRAPIGRGSRRSRASVTRSCARTSTPRRRRSSVT